MTKKIGVAALAVATACGASAGDLDRYVNYDESKIAPYALENPLDYTRGQILEIFAKKMYGQEPPKPEALEVEKVEEGETLDGFGLRRQYRIRFRKDGTGPYLDWLVLLPRHVKGPSPVVLFLNYNGNHQLLADPEVVVPTNVWARTKDLRLDPAARGELLDQSRRSVVTPRLLLSHGYALMSACYAQVSPDPGWKDPDPALRPEPFAYSKGVFDLWPKRDESRDDNITSLGAWAWALSRGLDLAERIPEIDAKRSVATGSSRLAKAALLASARDERFAVCVPNQTGGGGCPLAKHNYGENIKTQMIMFPHWYCKAYGRYQEDPTGLLDFDQHLLLASIAPRALLVQGFNSAWFDTKGEYMAVKAASCAWEAKGLPGLPSGGFPANYDTSAIGPRLGYVRRLGDHGLAPFDWQTLVDFADGVFGLDKVRPIDLQPKIDAAAAHGGGIVSVPAGKWVTKGLELRSNVELHLEPGAFLLGSTNLADYAVRELPYSEGEWRAVVSAYGATNVAVTGVGTIDGRGWAFPQPVEYGGEGLRPRGLVFGNCRGVRLTDFTFRDAACWGMVLKESEDVEIRRVRIDSHANANNDGIDIEAKRVVVADCEIDSGDDAVCIKSNDPGYIVEDILVTNVIARSNCNVFKLGTASHGTMRRVRFTGCRGGAATRDFPDLREGKGRRPWYTHVDRATDYAMGRMTVYRVDLAPFATGGVAVQCVDGGCVEDVVFENGTLAGVAVPFTVRGGKRTERLWRIPRGTQDVLRNVRIENVTATTAGSIPSWVAGVADGCRPENVVFRNVKVVSRGDKRATVAPVEERAGNYPNAAMFGTRLPAYGLYIRNAGDVRLENAVFDLAEGRTDPRPAIYREPEPWLKNRIARSPYAPINRPPHNRDELDGAEDYYPQELLSAYAREGVNGLWMLVRPLELAESHPRLDKLGRVAAKCAARGIRIWPLMIEPGKGFVTCPSEPDDLRRLETAVARIFTAVPSLGGMIALTHGERRSSCLSDLDDVREYRIKCPKCAGRSPCDLHNALVGALGRGMRAGNPKAELITWFYHPKADPNRLPWERACAAGLDEGAVFAYNFESGVEVEQLGKTRVGGDYWLSVPGPGKPFRGIAEAAKGRRLCAKIQVGCSHELATLPYVPVPGLLYRKYRAMRELGVTDAIQCWFFGGAPGLMNRAAGMLAREDFADGEEAFLLRLAEAEGHGTNAAAVVRSWQALARGYERFPVAIEMQYYGPLHAGATWPLLADIGMKGLPRSWKPQDEPQGDLIGECLANHTLDEARTLMRGAASEMSGAGYDAVSRAMVLQFEIAADIFDFYALRRDAVVASRVRGDFAAARTAVGKMCDILVRERGLRGELAALCRSDVWLGYHSEAEDRRYDEGKIVRAVKSLEETDRRLLEIEGGLVHGKPYPLSAHERQAQVCPRAVRVPEPERTVDVWTYDLCGTEKARHYRLRPTEGLISLDFLGAVPSQTPCWVLLDQRGKWRFPEDPELANRETRLCFWHLDGDRFALYGVQDR